MSLKDTDAPVFIAVLFTTATIRKGSKLNAHQSGMGKDDVVHGFSGTLLLLLSRFSRVRLCATPQSAAHQAPPSLGFSRQEHWSGLPFPSPVHESEK